LRTRDVTGRFLREEGGFTLVEIIVTTVMMIVVLLSLSSIFDMSVRAFSTGNNKVQAVENARVGLQKMEREIRAAYPVNANDPNSPLFFSANGSASNPPQAMPSQTQITFGNELGAEGQGDGSIKCGAPCEYITYKLSAPSNAPPCTGAPDGCSTLLRVNTANSGDPGDPVSENAVVPGGLTFTYLKSDGTTATSEGEIAKVRVSLMITVDPGTKYAATQRLTTEIDLRNR
jgi:type II secretory pathway component PulJ